MIAIERLCKSYGPLRALVDLDLTIPEGEVFGFLGPNGAGKTTTIRIVTGLVRPTSGTVKIGGHDIFTDSRAAKAMMGYVPDRPFLYEKLTGFEFIAFLGSLHGMERRASLAAVRPYLEMFDMTEHAHRLIEGYSHGMKQKLMIASSLVHSPKIFVVDEPMVGLDPRSAKRIRELLLSMRALGMSVLLSTHTLSVAEAVCDRIGIVHRGRMVAEGTMSQLKKQACLPGSSLEEVFLRLTEEEAPANARSDRATASDPGGGGRTPAMSLENPPEPRWYHEPWAVLFMLMIVPPVGYWFFIRSPQIRLKVRVPCALLIGIAVGVYGFEERRHGWLQSALDQLSVEEHSVRAAKFDEVGRHEEAAREWLLLFRRSPRELRWALNAGQELERAGRYREALSVLAAASPGGQLSMGGLAGVRAAAILLEDPVALDGHRTSDDALELADRLTETGQVIQDPTESWLMLADVETYRMQLGSAEQHIRRAINAWDVAFTGRAYHLLAIVRDRGGDRGAALRMLGQSLINAPRDAACAARLVEAARALGEPEAPYRAFALACQLDEAVGAHAPALKLLDRIVKRYPHLPILDAVEYRRGTCLNWHLQAYSNAIESYQAIVTRFPQSECHLRARFQIGLCHELMGEHAKAASQFASILKDHPRSHWGQLALVRMLELQRIGKLPKQFDQLLQSQSS